MEMNDAGSEMGFGAFLVAVALYLFFSYCLKLICEKGNEDPGILVWIPILQVLPTLKVAGLHPATILLYLIPIVNVVFMVVHWWKVCDALGRPPFLALMLLVPLLNALFFPLLAFTGPPPRG